LDIYPSRVLGFIPSVSSKIWNLNHDVSSFSWQHRQFNRKGAHQFKKMMNHFALLAACLVVFAQLSAAAIVDAKEFSRKVNVDASDFKFTANLRSNLTSTNSYAEAIEYGRNNPTRDGGSWAGW